MMTTQEIASDSPHPRTRDRHVLDAWTAALWSLAVLLAALALPAANWTDDLGLVPVIAAFALALGMLLVWSRFEGWAAAALGVGYGAAVVLWQMTSTLDPGMVWRERVFSLGGRVSVFLSQVTSGEPSHDGLMFVLAMAIVFWAIGIFGTWWIFRRRGLWLALLFPGMAIFLNVYYYRFGVRLQSYLPYFILASLALIVRIEYVGRREAWERQRAQIPSDISARMTQAGVVAALILVGAAWLWPSLGGEVPDSSTAPTAAGYSPVGEFFSDALAGLRAPVNLYGETFGDTLGLGAGVDPGHTAIFQASLEQEVPSGSRLYWRARVFDTYRDHEWKVTLGDTVPFRPREDQASSEADAGRREIDAVISPFNPATQLLYVPAELSWLNRSADLRAIQQVGDVVDVLEAASVQVIVPGESYRVRSRIAAPTLAQLRSAGTDYPDWVTASYLQLPDDFPKTVTALAREITGVAPDPYGKAEAITSWLRKNITYRRVMESPPAGVEPVEWFLIDARTGFCDYYASAEVLMLRSLGVPARVAVGYASGTYDAETNRYYVAASDSHSWPEVYFPGYGWVEFEPTLSQPELVRPEGEGGAGANAGGGDQAGETPGEGGAAGAEGDILRGLPEDVQVPEPAAPVVNGWPYIGLLAAVAAGILLLTPARAPAAKAALVGARLVGVRPPGWMEAWAAPPKTEASRIYRRLAPWPQRLGLRSTLEDSTPHERGAALAEALPDRRAEIHNIVDGYAAERYGGRGPSPGSPSRAWRAVRVRLYAAALMRVIDEILGRESG